MLVLWVVLAVAALLLAVNAAGAVSANIRRERVYVPLAIVAAAGELVVAFAARSNVLELVTIVELGALIVYTAYSLRVAAPRVRRLSHVDLAAELLADARRPDLKQLFLVVQGGLLSVVRGRGGPGRMSRHELTDRECPYCLVELVVETLVEQPEAARVIDRYRELLHGRQTVEVHLLRWNPRDDWNVECQAPDRQLGRERRPPPAACTTHTAASEASPGA